MTNIAAVRAGYEARQAAHNADRGPFAHGAAYAGGEIVPAEEAMVPLFDLGLLRSDLTYDVPAVGDGRFFRLHAQLARPGRSCAKRLLTPPMTTPRSRDPLIELVRR